MLYLEITPVLLYKRSHRSILSKLERFVRSIRSECLDYFIIFNYSQLNRIVKEYVDYYNNFRPHQGLKAIPNAPPHDDNASGKIKKKPLLFGLHHHYYRESA